MNTNEIMKELAEYNRIAEETAGIIDGLKDKIKDYMKAQGIDTLTGDEHKATWKAVSSTKLDQKALKAELPDIAARFTVSTSSMRFTFA